MDAKTIDRYRKTRASHPFMPARYALSWAKAPDASEFWEESSRHDGRWMRDVEGFTITLRIEDESIFPRMEGRNGETDYGSYVDESNSDYDYDWRGEWPKPVEFPPLGLSYKTIRYSGPGWVQGDMNGGYFIPDGVEDTFAHFRRRGQSKSVALDLTREDVESTLTMLFCSPLTYVDVIVTAHRAGVELASTCMGTDVSGDEEGRAYVFQMVEEHDMISEVVEQARETIAALSAS